MRESCHTYVDDVTARLHAGLLLILMCVGSDGIDTQWTVAFEYCCGCTCGAPSYPHSSNAGYREIEKHTLSLAHARPPSRRWYIYIYIYIYTHTRTHTHTHTCKHTTTHTHTHAHTHTYKHTYIHTYTARTLTHTPHTSTYHTYISKTDAHSHLRVYAYVQPPTYTHTRTFAHIHELSVILACDKWQLVISLAWMSHVTRSNKSYHTSESVMSHVWRRSSARMQCLLPINKSYCTCEGVILDIKLSTMAHLNESCHTVGALPFPLKGEKWQNTNKRSCRTWEWVMSHIWKTCVT